MSDQIILESKGLTKSYQQGTNELKILDNIDLVVHQGETISIIGSSGSGKSTLLHILAGLDRSTSGEVILQNNKISELADNYICHLRNKNLGFVYQFHHLLPEFNAIENILMPIMISGEKIDKRNYQNALDILASIGMAKRHAHYPAQLSGGERQRVAIARAVINKPKLIFADEPTGNLDNETSSQVLEVLFNLQKEFGTSLVIVTHDHGVALETQMEYCLHNGKLSLCRNDF